MAVVLAVEVMVVAVAVALVVAVAWQWWLRWAGLDLVWSGRVGLG